jgi:acetamidase/formamidase
MPKSNVVKRDIFHYKWSRHHKPVLHVRPGDKVTFEINEVTSWQITEKSTVSALAKFDHGKSYPLAGPVYIEGAKRGDALVVDIVKVRTANWGWSALLPGFGILNEFNKNFLWKWNLENGVFARFRNGIKIPIRPFCGVLGVAPPEDGYFGVMPPGKHGGNMDIRHLTAGSKLKLPVWVDGALFSAADVHAAQGDGEVCVTAIECPGEVTLRFDLERDANLRSPHYWIKGDAPPRRGYYGTTGIAPDLMEATRLSVRNMVSYLGSEYKLTPEEAYILCSVAADLRVHEVVDKPNWVVGTLISQDLFPRKSSH